MMAAFEARPGEVVDIAWRGTKGSAAGAATLVNTDRMRVVRLTVPAGKQLDTHKAPGDITLQTVEGRITLFVEGRPRELSAGQLVHLPPGVPHAVRGEADSVVLLTIVTSPGDSNSSKDAVQEASEESFPASDPPAYTPITRS